jgi:enterochelin esterase-like enzyme
MEFTFRWAGEAESVRVRGSIESAGDAELTRAGDGWSTTLDLPADVRAIYWFALDGEEDWTRWHVDPSNPKRYVYPADLFFTRGREVVASLLEGPEAQPLSWSVERDVPHGGLRLDELDGRRVWRYLPPTEPEALLLLFDGREYTSLAPAQHVLDNLLAAGLIPPTAAILPDSIEHAVRVRELDESAEFLDWCVSTLLPWSGFRAPRERTMVGGSSFGGKASLFFARERPDIFGGAIVQSGGFPGMPVEIPPGREQRFWLDVGLFEGQLLGPVRELRDDLESKGYAVGYREFPGGHDFVWWRETLADGLVHVLRPGGS